MRHCRCGDIGDVVEVGVLDNGSLSKIRGFAKMSG